MEERAEEWSEKKKWKEKREEKKREEKIREEKIREEKERVEKSREEKKRGSPFFFACLCSRTNLIFNKGLKEKQKYQYKENKDYCQVTNI